MVLYHDYDPEARLRPSDMSSVDVIEGPAHSGRTTMALDLALDHIAADDEDSVLFASGEDTIISLVNKIHIRHGVDIEADHPNMGDRLVFVEIPYPHNVAEIAAHLGRVIEQTDVNLLVVDGFTFPNREDYGFVIRALDELCVGYDLRAILTVQTVRHPR